MTASEFTPPLAVSRTRPGRLLYLDGLRGLAALYVVIHHAYMEVVSERVPVFLPFLVRHATNWLFFGQVAVDIFIVLSGYSLMLPMARSGNELRGGVRQYLLRRARRILPPYYAALILFVVVIALVPGMNQMQGFRWDAALPALTRGNLVAHLLLLQNLRLNWLHAIDPPMWSVATEWQIYFLFPVLLLPIWRRFGNLAMISAAFAVGLLPHFVLHNYDFACPWFLGLFALGAAAAAVSVRPSSASKPFLSGTAWACLLLLAVFFAAATFASPWLWGHLYVMDAGIGFLTAIFLCFCTGHSLRVEPPAAPAALRLLQTPAAALLGAFSYSLYLIHFPVLSLLHLWLRPLHLAPAMLLLVLVGAGAPLCLLLSYLFHLRFERPYMPGLPHNNAQAENAAAVSPAP